MTTAAAFSAVFVFKAARSAAPDRLCRLKRLRTI